MILGICIPNERCRAQVGSFYMIQAKNKGQTLISSLVYIKVHENYTLSKKLESMFSLKNAGKFTKKVRCYKKAWVHTYSLWLQKDYSFN